MSTYYKILPQNLKCKGFQYKEGLNIDSKEITPYRCDNGLHFSDEKHILGFCDYGSMIAEVELPEDAIVYHFDNKSKADKIILKNLRPLWSIDTIEALIQEGVDFETNKNLVLYEAAGRGFLDVVKYLVDQGANIHASDDGALCWASENGHLDVVKYLVEQGSDIHTVEDYPLRWASESGYSDVVKYLVEHGADIHARNDYALRLASEKGHLDIVKYLVEHGADIHAMEDWAILYADTPEIEEYLKSIK